MRTRPPRMDAPTQKGFIPMYQRFPLRKPRPGVYRPTRTRDRRGGRMPFARRKSRGNDDKNPAVVFRLTEILENHRPCYRRRHRRSRRGHRRDNRPGTRRSRLRQRFPQLPRLHARHHQRHTGSQPGVAGNPSGRRTCADQRRTCHRPYWYQRPTRPLRQQSRGTALWRHHHRGTRARRPSRGRRENPSRPTLPRRRSTADSGQHQAPPQSTRGPDDRTDHHSPTRQPRPLTLPRAQRKEQPAKRIAAALAVTVPPPPTHLVHQPRQGRDPRHLRRHRLRDHRLLLHRGNLRTDRPRVDRQNEPEPHRPKGNHHRQLLPQRRNGIRLPSPSVNGQFFLPVCGQMFSPLAYWSRTCWTGWNRDMFDGSGRCLTARGRR